MKTVSIDDVIIGEGTPKIIIPIVEKTEAEILAIAKEAGQSVCDLLEWRIDHFESVQEKSTVASLSKKVKDICGKPLLITFRSFKEGGVLDISDAEYFQIYNDLIENGTFDLLDIELFMPEAEVSQLIDKCHSKGIYVVLCNHEFHLTPSKDTIMERLKSMEAKGADICKIAVMPNSGDDVLTLLNATYERKQEAKVPLITMSMGNLGMISRLSGEVFGSSATFGALGEVSAPGQMPVNDLSLIINKLKLS